MKIELARSEIRRFVQTPWSQLNASEKRLLASTILRNRPDTLSQAIAFNVEIGNPNYNNFVVIENA